MAELRHTVIYAKSCSSLKAILPVGGSFCIIRGCSQFTGLQLAAAVVPLPVAEEGNAQNATPTDEYSVAA